MGLISNGTTIFDNGSMASGFGGNLKFISKATASASASIEFTSGIDSTYKEYVFYFNNIHPSTDGGFFAFNLSTDGGSTYAVTKTSTMFNTQHGEGGAGGVLGYEGAYDLAQSTSYQRLVAGGGVGNGSDESLSGYLKIFNPSSTTYVKHFIGSTNMYNNFDYCMTQYFAGYGNTTSSIDAVDFKFESGNIDSGQILLFGVN